MEGKYTTIEDLIQGKNRKEYVYKKYLSDTGIWKYIVSKEAGQKKQIEFLDPYNNFFHQLVGGSVCNIVKLQDCEDVLYYLCISRNSPYTERVQNICFCKDMKDKNGKHHLYTVMEGQDASIINLEHYEEGKGCIRSTNIMFGKVYDNDFGENSEADMKCFRNGTEAMKKFADLVTIIKMEQEQEGFEP